MGRAPLALAAALVFALGCVAEPTEVIVVVDAASDVGELSQLTLRVQSGSTSSAHPVSLALGLPALAQIVPGPEGATEFRVEAIGERVNGAAVAAAARVRFVDGSRQMVFLVLRDYCPVDLAVCEETSCLPECEAEGEYCCAALASTERYDEAQIDRAPSPGRCADGVRNGDETDVDCGGLCEPCSQEDSCRLDTDCISGVCGARLVCLAASCADACGGSCDLCADGQPCEVDADCASRLCVDEICGLPTCRNLELDGDETDVDCGGSCDPCGVGEGCLAPQDCETYTCRGSGTCRDGCFAIDGVECDEVVVTTLRPPAELTGAAFGYDVALQGEWIAVGAPGRNRVFLYRQNELSGEWELQQTLAPADETNIAHFGYALAMSADTLVIGAPFSDLAGLSDGGAAFVFRYDGLNWTEEARLRGSQIRDQDRLGTSVALDGDYVAVGAPHPSSEGETTGAAVVFVRSGGSWSETQHIPGDRAGARFGWRVALAAGTLAVSAINALGESGAVTVYREVSGTFLQQTEITADPGGREDFFGEGLELLDGPRGLELFVGARGESSAGDRNDDTRTNAGASYVYSATESDEWVETAYLKAPVIAEEVEFGRGIAAAGDVLWIGGPGDGSSGTLFDATPTTGGAALNYGAIHGFRWLGDELGFRSVLFVKAPENVAGLRFGRYFDGDETRLVVGAPYELEPAGLVWIYDFTQPPGAEVCDGFDNDGDGDVDETYDECAASCDAGLCR